MSRKREPKACSPNKIKLVTQSRKRTKEIKARRIKKMSEIRGDKTKVWNRRKKEATTPKKK